MNPKPHKLPTYARLGKNGCVLVKVRGRSCYYRPAGVWYVHVRMSKVTGVITAVRSRTEPELNHCAGTILYPSTYRAFCKDNEGYINRKKRK